MIGIIAVQNALLPCKNILANHTETVKKKRVWHSITEAVWQYADSRDSVNLDNEVICIEWERIEK